MISFATKEIIIVYNEKIIKSIEVNTPVIYRCFIGLQMLFFQFDHIEITLKFAVWPGLIPNKVTVGDILLLHCFLQNFLLTTFPTFNKMT